jgi:hypothetical protein
MTVYRVCTINPDRFDRPTRTKCEKKSKIFSDYKPIIGCKKKIWNFFSEFFIFIFECENLRHFGAAPALETTGGH